MMVPREAKGDVWYVYDGECPLCRTAARALRIREAVAQLHLVNAREAADHPVIKEINARGLDIDKGTVIKFGGNFYHGGDAMVMMALLGSRSGWFNRVNALLFRSESFARFCYPTIRSGRNLLLWFRGVGQIHNLEHSKIPQSPIFQSIFGEQWPQLPPVMHKHYANRPYCNDVVTVEGIMKVEGSSFARLLSPLLRVTGALVPYEGDNIPVTVHFRSEPNSDVYCFDRIFHFPGKPPYHFRSRMQPVGDSEVVEFMRIGIGWHARYSYDGRKVVMAHRGYAIKLFGKLVRLPFELLLGNGNAWEEALSDDRFCMYMDIRHKLWGKIYAYSGEFTVTEMALDR